MEDGDIDIYSITTVMISLPWICIFVETEPYPEILLQNLMSNGI